MIRLSWSSRGEERAPSVETKRLIALVALVALVVTGCGDEDDNPEVDDRFEAYCQVVEEQQRPLAEALAQGARTGLLAALPSFEALRAESPRDLADEWEIVVRRITEFRDALDDADVDPDTYDPEKPPPGLTEEQRAAIQGAANGLAGQAMRTALEGVQQHARAVCKTPLSL